MTRERTRPELEGKESRGTRPGRRIGGKSHQLLYRTSRVLWLGHDRKQARKGGGGTAGAWQRNTLYSWPCPPSSHQSAGRSHLVCTSYSHGLQLRIQKLALYEVFVSPFIGADRALRLRSSPRLLGIGWATDDTRQPRLSRSRPPEKKNNKNKNKSHAMLTCQSPCTCRGGFGGKSSSYSVEGGLRATQSALTH